MCLIGIVRCQPFEKMVGFVSQNRHLRCRNIQDVGIALGSIGNASSHLLVAIHNRNRQALTRIPDELNRKAGS